MEPKPFTFNRTERAGILSLILITVLLQLIPYFIPREEIKISYSKLEFPPADSRKPGNESQLTTTIHSGTEYFPFDPNIATKDEWIRLGVKEKIADNILKYRSKGGVFRHPDDLGKIWGLDTDKIGALKKFARIRSIERSEPFKKPEQKPRTYIEINTADSAMFESLPGIGAKLAGRIVNYRNRLGGFHSLDQLSEVYGLKDSLLKKAIPFMTIKPAIRQLKINNASEEELRNHPYFRPVAKIIIAYRGQHGNFSGPDDLRHIMIMNDSIIRKISPYISME